MQDPENEQTTPEAGENETPDYTAEPVEIFPETEPPSEGGGTPIEPEPPKKESRARRFFRKLLRWTLGILVVIGLGFLAAVFLIYQPKVDELNRAYANLEEIKATLAAQEEQIASLEGQVSDLNGQIDALNGQIEDLQNEKQSLLDAQDAYEVQIALLQARADVLGAQVALYEDNPAQARTLLDDTAARLETISTLLPEDMQDVVTPLQARLDLAVSELDTSPETAIKDLSILAGDLLEIENTLSE